MDLHLVKTASGLALIGCFSLKILVHILLDARRNPKAGFQYFLLFFVRFFKTYTADVEPSLNRLKGVCNALLYLSLAALIINLTVGIGLLFW